jgi:hypothetical protein
VYSTTTFEARPLSVAVCAPQNDFAIFEERYSDAGGMERQDE